MTKAIHLTAAQVMVKYIVAQMIESGDPVVQQIESLCNGTVRANDCFRPVSRYFDRITRPEHLLTALPRAFRTMTDPADCGPVTLAFCQDAQAEAYDYPESFFAPRVWRQRRIRPDAGELAAMVLAAKRLVIVAGGGVHSSGATEALKAFAEAHNIPVSVGVGVSMISWQNDDLTDLPARAPERRATSIEQ